MGLEILNNFRPANLNTEISPAAAILFTGFKSEITGLKPKD
jgi:hypothetical protein